MSEIKYRTNRAIRRKIDFILHEMAMLFANTGTDSTLAEMREAYRREQELMDEIKGLDPNFEKIIRPYGRQEF